jgi:FxLD family lantipeptide
MAMPTATSAATENDPDFDLDISIVASAPVVPGLMRSTDDNCGQTCQSACVSCRS